MPRRPLDTSNHVTHFSMHAAFSLLSPVTHGNVDHVALHTVLGDMPQSTMCLRALCTSLHVKCRRAA